MQLLERIINTSMKKYQQTPKTVNSEKTGGKAEDVKKNDNLTTQCGKKNKPLKLPSKTKPNAVELKPKSIEPKTTSKEKSVLEDIKIKELSKPITFESHATFSIERYIDYVLRMISLS